MKKLLIFAALALVSFASCTKQDGRCYVCTTTKWSYPNGVTAPQTSTKVMCDMTAAQISAYEANNTHEKTIEGTVYGQETKCR